MMRLCGKRPVLERLWAAPLSIQAIYLEEGTDCADIKTHADRQKIRVIPISRREFEEKAGQMHTQGIVAEVDDFSYTPLDKILEKSSATLFLLDRLTDPQNLGNIMRTLACFGNCAIILPEHESVEVTETVLRVACGGENYVPVARANLARASEAAQKAHFWIAGAETKGEKPLSEVKLPLPIGIVLGSEGEGIRPGLQKQCDLKFTLPMPGATLSFNVATAAALIAYEIVCRRKGKSLIM